MRITDHDEEDAEEEDGTDDGPFDDVGGLLGHRSESVSNRISNRERVKSINGKKEKDQKLPSCTRSHRRILYHLTPRTGGFGAAAGRKTAPLL